MASLNLDMSKFGNQTAEQSYEHTTMFTFGPRTIRLIISAFVSFFFRDDGGTSFFTLPSDKELP